MTLRTRLLLAQAPIALALLLIAVSSVLTVSELGRAGEEILAANYRSVLAAQRMKEALERIDSAAFFIVAGEVAKGKGQLVDQRGRFEAELQVQEGNITEPGEREATQQLRERWTAYVADLAPLEQAAPPPGARGLYLNRLEPTFVAAKHAADTILALNQDAMVRKSEALRKKSKHVNTLLVVGVLLALLLGISASTSLTHRALRPMGILSQAVRRIGQGDLAARAVVHGPAELKQLSDDFNAMAQRLQTYRQSSLGELLQAQQASQAAIDSLPDPVLVFGGDGALLNLNRAGETLLGLTLDSPGDPLMHAAPAIRDLLERVRGHVLSGKGGYVPRGFEEAVRIDGTDGPTFLLPRASPVYGEAAGIIGATIVLQDVTRLRRFDELKNDLVATVAHEFRTPLTSLRMAVHLIVEQSVGPITDKQAELLFAAREDCQRLQAIVDDLLDLSRIQSGSLQLDKQEVSASSLLDAAVAAHQPTAEQRGIRLRSRFEPFVEKLDVDVGRIGLVLSNLLTNALRHTPSGGEVTLSVLQAGLLARFEVADTGVGIPAEHQGRVFEKFFRVPGSQSEGAGLGLAIAREIVEAHQGEIGVRSQPGEGSCFWFTLPLRSA